MMMMHLKAATEKEAQARTWVIWDINTCPVPTECDASRVGPCIKLALKNLGYTGHVTITAIGILTEEHPPPCNILVISQRNFSIALKCLEKRGYNILPQVFYDYSREAAITSTEVESLWKSFLKDTMDSEEKCSETSEVKWICTLCEDDDIKEINFIYGQGFESFINHLLSQEHQQLMLDILRPDLHKSYEEKAKAFRDSHPMNAITTVNNEPKTSFTI